MVERRVEDACRRAGRSRSEVTIVCVTKFLSVEATRLLPDLGLENLGENRPQELHKKAAALSEKSVVWHQVGHLQRNKVELVLPIAALIHSVDSVRLLAAIEKEAAKRQQVVPVLLEVNASGEVSKHGFAPAEVSAVASAIEKMHFVQVNGLMTMAAPLDAQDCRPTFAALRGLRDDLRKQVAPTHPCEDLSMGMTNDFEVAIEEGATYIRLGSIYFEGWET